MHPRYNLSGMRRTLLTLLPMLVWVAALAAAPIAQDTPHGVMMLQAMHTLGAWEVACPAAAAALAAPGSEVTCAQVPGSMYGFFREAVHGRLYEYLSRKTLVVTHDWSTSGDVLSVSYAVDGGTLSVARLRADGVLYAVFRFAPPARASAATSAATSGTTMDRRAEVSGAPSSGGGVGTDASAPGGAMQP